MKNALLLIFAAVILASCGSNKGFHNKHHNKLKWVKVESTKIEKDLTQKEEVRVLEEEVAIVDEPIKSEDSEGAESEKVTDISALAETKRPAKALRKALRSLAQNQATSEATDESVSNGAEVVKNQASPKNITKSDKTNSGNGDLLLLALLLAVIIVLIWLLPGPLGYLLSLVIFIFLVLLLLRYLGLV